ncbi:unnamed protein product, partial [Porites evermanni]
GLQLSLLCCLQGTWAHADDGNPYFKNIRVDYCNSLLYGLPENQLNKLQRVQNMCARLICNESKYCHITPLLVDLHWLPVKFRIEFKILLIAFKIFKGLAPSYLSFLI